MLVPIEWLNDYIDLKDIDTTEFCDRMILSGSDLETCEHFCEEMENALKQVLRQAKGEVLDEKSDAIPFEELPLKLATHAVACKIVVEKTVQIQSLETRNQEMNA